MRRSMDEWSDIDEMVVFSDGSVTPQTYLNRLKAFVERCYGSSEIDQSSPRIVLELNYIKFDLVAVTKIGFGEFQIPNGSGGWMSTNPNDFNAMCEARNKGIDALIKPTIRLMKYWDAASEFLFDSFALEQWICGQGFW
ncbi:SMODS domain-containing nucleotidyltransferase [Xylella fastidiosa]|nr:hypothetical protein [Xylella fastidiosa]ACA13114.1 conserved hypothetical protein [Xylella fastidiosa M12]MBE0267968.1 hypothetical protein [Xylella fastidiosa subsp. multiplex]MBE0274551.1 hypothetical protein [Xylella fastidiosa subsp. multiplex]MBS9445168.1 hypothetical protein [Xylella fastidiosa subsp. multiplex]MBS9447019.1 hypothetical protein [Xylella fastidiosa subsp. multiplex]